MSLVMMASTPAKGPRPTTLIQISAQISVSTPRIESENRRAMKRTMAFAMVLRAARKPSGKDRIAASSVPKKAMATVSAKALSRAQSCVPGDGGTIIPRNVPSWTMPVPSRARENSSRTSAKMARPASAATTAAVVHISRGEPETSAACRRLMASRSEKKDGFIGHAPARSGDAGCARSPSR